MPLPRLIVSLIRRKERLWRAAKISGDYSVFKQVRRYTQAAIRHHHRNVEEHIIYQTNYSAFFKHLCVPLPSKCGKYD